MINYLITDQKFYGNTQNSIVKKLSHVAKKYRIDYACLRDKTTNNYEALAIEFILVCKDLDIKPILHTFWLKALNLGAFGVHFSAVDSVNIASAKKSGLNVISSTHSFDEAHSAIELGADLITVSPIFDTPGKNRPIGLVKLKEITDKIPDKIIALGGILEESQVEACKEAGAVGFASIRYFVK